MKSIQNPNNQSSQITKLIKNEEQNQNITNSNVFISKTENTNQKNYCSLCKKSFSTMGNLRNHIMTIHENQKPFKCPFPNCEKKYSSNIRLNVHIRTHTGIKPFKCNICHKSFNENGNLKTHERFHSELRPFKCDKCSKTYKTNGHLKDHIEIQHLKIRKFECKYCEKKFGRISTLKAHIRTHTGEKNYKCHIDGCNKFFAEKGNMEIHYKRHLKRINNENFLKNQFNNINGSITRPSSNSTLFNLHNNNIFSSFNNQISIQNNNNNNDINLNITKNDGYIDNMYKNNSNFIINENGNITFPIGNSNFPLNNNDKTDSNCLDFPQNINFECDKDFEVNSDN